MQAPGPQSTRAVSLSARSPESRWGRIEPAPPAALGGIVSRPPDQLGLSTYLNPFLNPPPPASLRSRCFRPGKVPELPELVRGPPGAPTGPCPSQGGAQGLFLCCFAGRVSCAGPSAPRALGCLLTAVPPPGPGECRRHWRCPGDSCQLDRCSSKCFWSGDERGRAPATVAGLRQGRETSAS